VPYHVIGRIFVLLIIYLIEIPIAIAIANGLIWDEKG
jgi:hypothetical protein